MHNYHHRNPLVYSLVAWTPYAVGNVQHRHLPTANQTNLNTTSTMKTMLIAYWTLMLISSGIGIAWVVAPRATTITTITGASLFILGHYAKQTLRK